MEPQSKRQRPNYSKCTCCRRDKKKVREDIHGVLFAAKGLTKVTEVYAVK